jgi:hypothetical protein
VTTHTATGPVGPARATAGTPPPDTGNWIRERVQRLRTGDLGPLPVILGPSSSR